MKAIYKVISFTLIIAFCMNFIIHTKNEMPKSKDVTNVYYNNKNDSMKIALTFDDGPHPKLTPKILDVLDKYNIKATFFVIGINANNYPNTLKEIKKRGHEIANHTYNHPHLSSTNENTLTSEINKCQDEIYKTAHTTTNLFRPPEGFMKGCVETVARSLNYKVILWDIDTRDWAHTPPHEIYSNVVNNIKSGDVILMHDFIGHNSPTIEALELFIPVLIEKGYHFVTVSELIGSNQ